MTEDEAQIVVSSFHNYWELYTYVMWVAKDKKDFNQTMGLLRPMFLDQLTKTTRRL